MRRTQMTRLFFAKTTRKPPLEQQSKMHDGWPKTQKDFYEEVVSHYKDSYEVKCHTEGGECDSESNVDEGDNWVNVCSD